jgi:hypothetical protein
MMILAFFKKHKFSLTKEFGSIGNSKVAIYRVEWKASQFYR